MLWSRAEIIIYKLYEMQRYFKIFKNNALKIISFATKPIEKSYDRNLI